jgi:hypothetical protein
MKMLTILAALGLSVAPALAADNYYNTSTKLSIGQFAGNCASIGGDYTSHGSNAGTCKTDSGLDVTCARDQGITTCSGTVPKTPKAPS